MDLFSNYFKIQLVLAGAFAFVIGVVTDIIFTVLFASLNLDIPTLLTLISADGQLQKSQDDFIAFMVPLIDFSAGVIGAVETLSLLNKLCGGGD